MNTDKQQKTKTSLEQGFEKILTPFQAFIKDQTTSSVLLVISTLIAVIIANTPLSARYEHLLGAELGLVFGDLSFTMSLQHWINDGLMAFFFFLIGMEIKREILVGELKEFGRFMLVFTAAVGGMLVPAAVFIMLNAETVYAEGWGIAMATDTAFVIGIMALLGRHVPAAAFAFLTALAIIDDLGAIAVIAMFYSESISTYHIGVCAILLMFMILANILGIRKPSVYFTSGVMIWLTMLGSGIHATIAGILVAATVPARPKHTPGWFFKRIENLLDRLKRIEKTRPSVNPILGEPEQHALVEDVKDAAERATTPLRRWERALEHPISLFVLPVFALANAGIPLTTDSFTGFWFNTLSTGIVLGLVIGKSAGITLFAWLALHLKIGHLPSSLGMRHVVGLALLGGIGFTMSIFVSNLAFDDMPEVLLRAKIAILTGSLISGALGYLWLRFNTRDATGQ